MQLWEIAAFNVRFGYELGRKGRWRFLKTKHLLSAQRLNSKNMTKPKN
jgi:hypothetical protein